ncbi:hypothetical protein Syun_006042 [Stephania yunnanensis]|uniref:Uncharacterized protein n=1 Tax=Stephania yunnanensis TaxID=152371 RepID=A0AAP0Q0Z3_9MAGN
MLTLEESGLAKEATMASDSAMVAASNEADDSSFVHSHTGQGKGQQHSSRKQTNPGRKNFGGRGNGGGKHNKSGPGGRFGKRGLQRHLQQASNWGWSPSPHWGWPQWAAPPSPMPTQGWAGPSAPNRGPGVLGPRPHQEAYQASMAPFFNGQSSSYAPTDIESAMHTMTLNPSDSSWYMDTGATSHMTSSNGAQIFSEPSLFTFE